MVFCNGFIFESFVPNIRLLFKNTYLLSCGFHFIVFTYFTLNLDSVKLHWLKHCINLELLSVDLPHTYNWMFQVSVNSNVLYIPTRNMHAFSTNQIADIQHTSVTYSISAIWLIEKSTILAILSSLSQYIAQGLTKNNNIWFQWREKKMFIKSKLIINH